MLALLGTSPALLAGAPVHAEPAAEAAKNGSPASSAGPITVLNPAIAGKLAERIPLGPRLESLQGKTIYLVDIQWGGPDAAYSVFEEVQAWFAQNMPSVKTVLRRTTGNMFQDDPGMRKELIEKKADAAIVGIAG
jgi:hypothetical protein